eukprot:COSAG01_NODE_909_length_12785_cov_4.201876_2_plen_72_part_00
MQEARLEEEGHSVLAVMGYMLLQPPLMAHVAQRSAASLPSCALCPFTLTQCTRMRDERASCTRRQPTSTAV